MDLKIIKNESIILLKIVAFSRERHSFILSCLAKIASDEDIFESVFS